MLRPESYMFPQDCHKDPAFRCEDHVCHASAYRNYAVECGDGSCARHVSNTCANSRDLLLTKGSLSGKYISDGCRRAIDCFTGFGRLDHVTENDCAQDPIVYANLIEQYCPELIELPPRLFGHVQFIYTNNQSQVCQCLITIIF
jgi:hypothetical protein